MAVVDLSVFTPLYFEVLFQILCQIAKNRKGAPGLDYQDFKDASTLQDSPKTQSAPLKIHLQLLESFLQSPTPSERRGSKGINRASSWDLWIFEKRPLTILDLTCPLVND